MALPSGEAGRGNIWREGGKGRERRRDRGRLCDGPAPLFLLPPYATAFFFYFAGIRERERVVCECVLASCLSLGVVRYTLV